jgi:hypothetical protein
MGSIWNLRLAAAQTLNLLAFPEGQGSGGKPQKGRVALTEKRGSGTKNVPV